jgi:anthraniloyl-CoA monooxygenase
LPTGYLVSEFLSSSINKRKDEFGGHYIEYRARLGELIISGVREAIQDDEFPIFVKFNATDCVDGGTIIEDAVEFSKIFERAGASELVPSCGLNVLEGDPFSTSLGDFPLDRLLELVKEE